MAACSPAMAERFVKSLADLRHAVSSLQARARSQDTRISELGELYRASAAAGSTPAVSSLALPSPRSGPEGNGQLVRQLAARLDQQGHSCDERLRILEGRYEALALAADTAANSATAAATEAAEAVAAVRGMRAERSSPRPCVQRHSFLPELQDLGSRVELLEADTLALNRELASHDAQLGQLARWRQQRGHHFGVAVEPPLYVGGGSLRPSCAADSPPQTMLLNEVKNGLRQYEDQSHDVTRNVELLQSRMQESQQEFLIKITDIEERLSKQERQVVSHVEQLRSETAKIRGAPEACRLEALVRASAGDLRLVREEHRGLDLQVSSITASIRACGEEQERLAEQAAERDQWLRTHLGELAAAGDLEVQRNRNAESVAEQVEQRLVRLQDSHTESHIFAKGVANSLATLEARIDNLSSDESRSHKIESRLARGLEDAVERAELATEVARAAETVAETTEADNRASGILLESRLEAWLEARRDQRRDAREEFRHELSLATDEAAIAASAAATAQAQAAASRAASGLRAFGLRAEEESQAAERLAKRAEDGVQQLRARTEESEAATRLARRAESIVGQLKLELRSSTERSEMALSTLSSDVGDVREEMRLEKRRGKEAAEATAAAQGDLQVAVKSEVSNALGSFRTEIHEQMSRVEAKLAQFQNQHAQEMTEQLNRIGDQFVYFEERLAPDALACLIRREVEESARDAVFEEIRELRSGWCQKTDHKLDCTMQCLHVLYLKVGLSPSGALSSLQRAIRDSPGAPTEPPLSPGGPGGGGYGGALPRPGSPHLNGRPEAYPTYSEAWSGRVGPQGSGTPGGRRGRSPSSHSPRVPSLGGHTRRLNDYSMIE